MGMYHLSDELRAGLADTADAMVAPGKGILAADESSPTIKKRFDAIDLASTEETRQAYREMLFTAPDVQNFISGVILFEETLGQKDSQGTPFPELLKQRGIIPGIKVDKGLARIPGTREEKATQGLDGLGKRLTAFAAQGARFAKWRAVIHIGDHRPSRLAVDVNAHGLARYAALSQDAGLVPIVEPEILMTGGHDIHTCDRVSEWVLERVFSELVLHRVFLEGMVLKPSMVTSGDACPEQAEIDTVAEASIRVFRRTVPAAVPGIAFLSGGQSSELATAHLNAMNQKGPHPWELSFSYGRALQEHPLKVWAGKDENVPAAQAALLKRARCNGAARYGEYSPGMESG
ncbi:class I fructose-bisphosphate aldolase [Desulfospira joergensenii]|uniref:class I fructose-bisphosphate aldolase n=1 Tax=Desulfospira joergensenii TaxID=53329 RepID=UPI0003B4EC67|nr:class I fructose-bisphosphate aldolase [Desulfospira joergensenii]